MGIPEVKPPGSSKKELLKDVDFSVIDHHALKVHVYTVKVNLFIDINVTSDSFISQIKA